jgi:hypothetical protein
MTDPSDLRIGDRERDAVTEALHDAFAQGRIDRAELDERLTATLSAKTAADLRRVTDDLPASDSLADWERAERSRRVDDARRLGEDYGRQVAGPHTHGGPGFAGPFGPFGPFGPDGPLGRGVMGPGRWGPGRLGPAYARRGRFGPQRFGPQRFGYARRGGPPFPLVVLGVLAIVALVSGSAWPLFLALKVLFFLWIAAAVFAIARFRHHQRRRF